jgi:hypothetical protein
MARLSSNSEAIKKLVAGVETHDKSVESEWAVRGEDGGEEVMESSEYVEDVAS